MKTQAYGWEWMLTSTAQSGRRERGRARVAFVALGLVVLGVAACAGISKESGTAAAPWQWRTPGPGYYGGPPYGWR